MFNRISAPAIAMCFGTLAASSPAVASNYAYTQIQIGGNQFACAVGINLSNNVIGEYYGEGSAPFGLYEYYPSTGTQLLFNPPKNTGVLDPCAYVLGIAAISDNDLAVGTDASDVHHSFAPFTWNPDTGKTEQAPTLYRISVPIAVNVNGDIVGTGDKNTPFAGHGILVSGGHATQFDPPGSTRTVPTDIAHDGAIAGFYQSSGTHGFVRMVAGAYKVIDVPGSTDTEIFSINNAGQVAGEYYDSTVEHYRGFTAKTKSTIVTYRYPGAGNTEILRILKSGLVIGNYEDSSSVYHGFTYLGGTYTTLIPPSGAAMQVRAVNNLGNFVGNTGDANGGFAYVAICPTGICQH